MNFYFISIIFDKYILIKNNEKNESELSVCACFVKIFLDRWMMLVFFVIFENKQTYRCKTAHHLRGWAEHVFQCLTYDFIIIICNNILSPYKVPDEYDPDD